MGGAKGRTPMRGKLREYSVKFLHNVRILFAMLKLVLRGWGWGYTMTHMANFSPAKTSARFEGVSLFSQKFRFGADIRPISAASLRKFTRFRLRIGQNSYSVNFTEKRYFGQS